jgi:hypothetical protein
MEILEIPPKLQLAILNPDKRLTVDLRVRPAAVTFDRLAWLGWLGWLLAETGPS